MDTQKVAAVGTRGQVTCPTRKEIVIMVDIQQMIIEATNKNELYKLLLGSEQYKIEISSFIGTNVPTDWPNIMRGIYKIYCDYPSLEIKEKLENTLETLLSNAVFEIYVSVSVLFFQILSEENKTSPFKIDRERIINITRGVLLKNRVKMSKYTNWMGAYYKNGIWGEMERINNILKEDYGICILEK